MEWVKSVKWAFLIERTVRLAESVARVRDRERAVALRRDFGPVGGRMRRGGATPAATSRSSRRPAACSRAARRRWRGSEHAGDGLVVIDVRDEDAGHVVFDAD